MENKRPGVGVGVLIFREGKVLLGKRKGAHGEGTWCPPGGHLEFSETWEECAQRETIEETGIKIKNIDFITATNDIHLKDNKHYITLEMKADYDSGEVKNMEPDRCEKWDWFSWDNLPSPLFMPIQTLVEKGYKPGE